MAIRRVELLNANGNLVDFLINDAKGADAHKKNGQVVGGLKCTYDVPGAKWAPKSIAQVAVIVSDEIDHMEDRDLTPEEREFLDSLGGTVEEEESGEEESA